MADKENPNTTKTTKTTKTIDDLEPGDIITMDVPCKVRVLRIREVEGSFFSGNRQVFWEVVQPLESTGVERLGSKLDVSVWERT